MHLKNLAVSLALAVFAGSAWATTWTGGSSGEWNNADNWDGGVPVAGSTAAFNSSVTITDAIVLPSGKIIITVAKDKTLDLNGVISGAGALDVGVKGDTANVGIVNFNASNTFTGNLTVAAGQAHAKADNAFGDSATGRVTGNGGLVYVDGVTVLRRLDLDGSVHVFEDGSVLGYLTYYSSSQPRWQVKGRVRWTGGGGAYGTLWLPTITSGSELVVDTTKVSLLPYTYYFAGKLTLAVAGNDINNFNGNGSCYSGTRISYRVQCNVNNAISELSNLCFEDCSTTASGGSYLDLNSTTQSVKKLYSLLTAAERAEPKRLGHVTSAAGGLITVNDTVDFTNCNVFAGTASLAINHKTAGLKAILYGASTSSGELFVQSSSTVVFANGSQWAGVVHVPAGVTMTAESASAFVSTTTLSLEGGTLTVPDGATLFVKALRKTDGTWLETGFYQPSDIGISGGDGTVIGVNIPTEPQAEKTYTWVGGHGTSVQTAANWQDGNLPDFSYNGNVLTFPANATADFDCAVNAMKLVFAEAASGTTRLTASGDGRLNLFYGTVSVAGTQTVEIGVPVNFYGKPGIEVAEGSVLRQTGKIISLSDKTDVYKWGAGDLWIVGDDNDFGAGNMVFSNGYFYVSGEAPLGGMGTLYNQATAATVAKTSLLLSNAVVTCAYSCNDSSGNSLIGGCPYSTNKITGTVSHPSGFFKPRARGNGCVFEIATTQFGSGSMLWYQTGDGLSAATQPYSTSLFKITSTLSYFPSHFYQGGDSTYGWKYLLEIASPSNILCTSMSSMPKAAPFTAYGGFFYGTRLAVDDAIHPWVQLNLLGTCTRIDLGGHVQHLHNLIIGNCSLDSNLPAGSRAATDTKSGLTGCIFGKEGSKLVLTGTPVCGDSWDGISQDQLPNFGGAASFERAGAGTNTFRCVNTSTGDILVSGGRLTFAKKGDVWNYWTTVNKVQTPTEMTTPVDATWVGKKVTVTGGTLALNHTKVFPADVEVYADGGTVELADGKHRFGKLYVKDVYGEWTALKPGTYGAADNVFVSADHRLSVLSGSGTVRVGRPGVVMFVR